MSDEILTKGDLPHWYVPGAAHFVTFRLFGKLPRDLLDELRQQREEWLKQPLVKGESRTQQRERIHKQLFARYDRYLDQGSGECWLKDPRVAALVRRSLYHLHGKQYDLKVFCIMPNHVHVVFVPFPDVVNASRIQVIEKSEAKAEGCETHPPREIGEQPDQQSPLSRIMHSLKSYTAHEINKLLNRTGSVWQRESYDHWIRDEKELERIVHYVNGNPVEAKLSSRPEDWFWSSAHDRFLFDGDTSGWLRWE